jgi:transcriptional regulator with XRE-family HTH domain
VKNVNDGQLKRAFGDALATARHEAEGPNGHRGLSLNQLSTRSGIEILQINAFEAGTIMPDLGDVYALAGALDMHPAELLPVMDRDGDTREASTSDFYPEDDDDDDEEDDEDAERDIHRAGG